MNGNTDYSGLSRDELLARLRELERGEAERARLLHDLEVHQVELEQQNHELHEVHAELALSRSRYADLFDFAPMGHLVLDAMGRIRQANRSAESLLGRERENLTGRYLADFLLPTSQIRLGNLLWRMRQGSTPSCTDLQIPDEREPITLSVRCRELSDPDNAQRSLHLSLVDVSAERRAEARLALFARTTEEGIVFSRDGRILDCNQQFAGMLDYPVEELQKQAIADLIAPEDRERIMANIRRRRESDVEHDMLRRDGSRITVTAHGRPNPEAGDGSRITIVRDITEQRRTRALLQLVTDSAPLMISYVDAGQRYRLVNTGYEDWYGKSRGQLLGRRVREVMGEETYGKVRAHIEQALAGERQNYEDWFRFPGREPRHFTISYVPHRGDADRVCGFVTVVQDTTERERSEQALRQSEAGYRLLVEQSPDGIFLADAGGYYCDVNRAGTRMLGYDREEILRMQIKDVVMEEEIARIPEEVARFADGGVVRSEWRVKRKDGSTFLGEVVGRQLPDGRLQGILRDITRRRTAEAERLADLEHQRDTLVREVHHRIKNHLQGVVGLLRNHAGEHPDIAAPLEEAIAQIRTIARIYGLQSRRGNARVPLGELISLAAGAAAGPVTCLLPEDDHSELDRAEAVPIALVINELITNALKHRQGEGRPVQVSLEALDGGSRMRVRGGPARLPDGFDLARRQKLGTGLELVSSLLPRKGTRLQFLQQGDEVVAELLLKTPVVRPGNGDRADVQRGTDRVPQALPGPGSP